MDGGPDTARGPLPLRRALDVPPSLESPRMARRFLATVLDGLVDEDTLDTAILLTTELVTNAVVHAGTQASVAVLYDGAELTVKVTDKHPHRIAVPTPGGAEHDSDGGRGLALVEALASAWGSEHLADAKTVWFRLDAAGDAEALPWPYPDDAPTGRDTAAPAVPDAGTRPAGAHTTVPDAEQATMSDGAAAYRRTGEGLLGRLSPLDGIMELLHRLRDGLPVVAVAVRRTGEDEDTAAVGEMGAGPCTRLPLATTDGMVGELTLWPVPILGQQDRAWLALVTGRLGLALRVGELRGAEERRTGMLSFLAEASDLLAGTLDVEHAVALLAQLPVPRLADWATVRLLEGGGPAVSHRDEAQAAAVERRLTDPGGPLAAVVERALRTGHGAAATAHDAAGGAESVLSAPLQARRQVLGTLTVGRPAGRPYLGDEVDLLTDLARRAALAIDNARLYERQAHVAQALQASLLPAELPELPGLELGAAYRVAGSGLDVGGDFYDVAPSGPDAWTLSIGDVCGKGPEAAAITGVARDVLRLLHREGRALPDGLRQLNRTLRDQGARSRFCTVAVARTDLGARDTDGLAVSLCLAGHPQPVLLRADGRASLVGTPGTLLGLLDEDHLVLAEVQVRLAPGDTLVFYTDGVTETRSGDELFGEARLLRTVAAAAGRPAQEMADELQAAAARFASDGLRDDLAVLAVRVV